MKRISENSASNKQGKRAEDNSDHAQHKLMRRGLKHVPLYCNDQRTEEKARSDHAELSCGKMFAEGGGNCRILKDRTSCSYPKDGQVKCCIKSDIPIWNVLAGCSSKQGERKPKEERQSKVNKQNPFHTTSNCSI